MIDDKEYIVRCGNCNNQLAEIIINKTNEQREESGMPRIVSKVKITDCPKCGGSSFVSPTFEGSIFVGNGYNLNLLSTEVDDKSNVYMIFSCK